MSTWIPVVIAIVAALGFGLLREHFRVSGVERWAKAKGFVRPVPFAPAASSPAVTLAAQLHPRGARLWGIGLEGLVDVSPCTIAEYAASKPGTRTGDEWFTLVFWPSAHASDAEPSLRPAAPAWPHDGVLVRGSGYAGWRIPGPLTTARLDQVVKGLPEARRHLA